MDHRLIYSHNGRRSRGFTFVILVSVCLLHLGGVRRSTAQGSLSAVAREAEVALDTLLEIDGEPWTGDRPPAVLPDGDLAVVYILSWSGPEDLIAEVRLGPISLRNAELPADTPLVLTLSQATASEREGRRLLRWRVHPERQSEGAASVSDVEAEVVFQGFEDRPALPVAGEGLSWIYEAKPFPVVAVLIWVFSIAVLGAALYFGGRFLVQKAREYSAPEDSNPVFSSSADPTPFERSHAELATCEMKAQTGDIEGFFGKFKPIIYNFAAATEGPGVKTLNADELAHHLESVDYNPKYANLLVECLKVCERYEATGQEPSEELCLSMARDMRAAASACAKRSPRGTKAS